MRVTRWGTVEPESCRNFDDGSPAFMQWWYFDGEFESGHRLMTIIQPRLFARVGAEPSEPVPGVTFSITTPELTNHRELSFHPGALRYQPDEGVVHLGPNRIEAHGGAYRLVLNQARLGCDLTYTPVLAPWAPLPGGDGFMAQPLVWAARARVGLSDFFRYASMVPRGQLEGTIRVDGNEVRVRGAGYHERGLTNVPFAQLFASWYWARLFVDDWTFVFPVAQTPLHSLNRSMRAMLVAKGSEIVLDAFDVSGLVLSHRVRRTELHRESGRELPRDVIYTAKTRSLRVTIELETFHERESYLFSPFAGATPLQPVWQQHLAHAKVRVTRDGREVELRGEAILEVMLSGAR